MSEERVTLHVDSEAPEADCTPSYCVVMEGPDSAATIVVGSGRTPWAALRQAAERWEELAGDV